MVKNRETEIMPFTKLFPHVHKSPCEQYVYKTEKGSFDLEK